MDLDALAGVIAHRHTGDGVTTVTAAVDRITIENPLMEICDLELSGQVTYATGRSSMEVSCQVVKVRPEGLEPRPEDVLITCAFTMVSLDPATKKSVYFPRLQPQTLTRIIQTRLRCTPCHRDRRRAAPIRQRSRELQGQEGPPNPQSPRKGSR